MKRNAIAFLGALALLFTAGTYSASAQTAGGSILEQVSHLLKDSYSFGFNSKGTSLTLRNTVTGTSGVILDRNEGSVIMRIHLGNLSALSESGREAAREKITFLNTDLAVGTILIADGGDVMMEHYVRTMYAQATGVADMVTRFAAEAARQRVALFG